MNNLIRNENKFPKKYSSIPGIFEQYFGENYFLRLFCKKKQEIFVNATYL
jgi:hypothetical protein